MLYILSLAHLDNLLVCLYIVMIVLREDIHLAQALVYEYFASAWSPPMSK